MSANHELRQARCVQSVEWLAARAAVDPAREAAARTKLADLIARYRFAGVQPDGDLFAVVNRVVAAMEAGDAAAVSARPCN